MDELRISVEKHQKTIYATLSLKNCARSYGKFDPKLIVILASGSRSGIEIQKLNEGKFNQFQTLEKRR